MVSEGRAKKVQKNLCTWFMDDTRDVGTNVASVVTNNKCMGKYTGQTENFSIGYITG